MSRSDTFQWSEAYETCQEREDVRLIDSEASDFGLRNGYVVPISMIDGNLAAVSFGGPDAKIAELDLSVLNFAANYAVGSYLHSADARRRINSRLTPREWDCLLWAGEGKTDWEISVILGSSRSTIIKHMASAGNKLGAVNKAHAIAQALRIRLLR